MRVHWGIAAVLVVGFTTFAADARTAVPVRCDGHLPTINGTSGNDVIVGTQHRDVIAAYGGDDVIDGAGGNDIICGGQGIDTATYASAPAGVTVDLAAGTATGGNGSDRLTGIENIVGSSFSDTLSGNSGDNVLTGGAGDDVLAGGGGTDTVSYAAAGGPETVDLAAGTATGDGADILSSIANVIGSNYDDNLYGDEAANILDGGGGADLLQSFGGPDVLNGGSGDDILRGGDGVDTADGGAGTDACVDVESQTACEQGGGTLNIDMSTDVDSTDPAFDYLQTGWQLEYATCMKLMNFPDGSTASPVPQPEAAIGMPLVSADGMTYTFTIRRGIRFSPPSNEPLTAESFKHEFDRVLSPTMGSPGATFISDVSSVTASGQTLTIVLNAPALDLLARLTMPFFCAVPTDLPFDSFVKTPASAGPYFIASRTVNSEIDLSRNPNYRGRRPNNFDRIVYRVGSSLDQTQAEVENGTADYAASGIPAASYDSVNTQYGAGSPAAAAGRQRFFVNPTLETNYLALNTSRPVFANETLRQAVATALDRTALASSAGPFALTPTDQYLPPGTPGFVDESIYPLTGDLDAATALAASQGVTPDTPVSVVLYTSDRGSAPQRAQIIKDTLAKIGFDVTIDAFPRGEQIQREGTRGEPFDMTTEGWFLDYNDPFDFINVLLDGHTITDTGNVNVSYFDNPTFNGRMESAAQLTGQARYDAYASLEHDLVHAAPLVAYSNANARDYFSDRIGCQTYGSFGIDLASLCIH